MLVFSSESPESQPGFDALGKRPSRRNKIEQSVARAQPTFAADLAILALMSLPVVWPAPLERVPAAFSHPDWLFEIKWDGFRALAYLEEGQCRLLSRNRNEFKSFPVVNLTLPLEFRGHSAVLDGEIVCLDGDGKPNFRNLLFRRGEPRFMAFDIPWSDGEDLRSLPLIERKHRLRGVVPMGSERLLYCDHVEDDGQRLFRLAWEHDLEGDRRQAKI